jgi:putative ABC transport system permease protein
MTASWVDASDHGDPGPPDGPRIKVEVVGLTRTPADFGRWKGLLHLSPAFVERYGGQISVRSGVAARLSDEALRRARRGALAGLAGAEMGSSPFGDDAATDDGLGTIATALRLVAAAAVLAGAIATALALVRLSRLALRDRPVLVALGWTKPQLMGAVALVLAPWLAVSIGIGLPAGLLASPLALVGLARSVDPTPRSVLIDTGVVLSALVGAVIVGVLMVAIAAQRAASPRGDRARQTTRPLALRRPLPLVFGVRHALFGEAASGGRTSRGAVAAVAAGVVGAVAAFTVSASIARLQTDPSLTGQGTGRVIDSGESVDVYDRALPLLEQDHRVAMLTGIHVSFSISAVGAGDRSAVGAGDLTTLAYDIRRGDPGASVVRGRMAQQPDEAAFGPATLDHLGKDVGDRIVLRGTRGTAEFRIVGSVLFPEGDFAYDDGVALTASGADRLLGNVHDAGQIHQVAFEWARGVDAEAADRGLASGGLPVLTNELALKPAAVNNLGEVEALPRYLALFVGLLCLVTLGHALAVSVRLRAREMGTLRTLGMTPRASGAIVGSHALTIVAIAVAVGVPVGLRAGERVWTPIANRAHVVVRTVAPWSWIALLLVIAIVATSVLTAIPTSRVLRLRPADTLRAE